jgi:8-hydroxy-5-deazaflavin:NADPH oxidoreductase
MRREHRTEPSGREAVMSSIRIAVIGSGIIGRTLATRFAQARHTVAIGVRMPGNAELAAFAAGFSARVTGIDTAIDDADVVLLAINGAAMPDAVPAFGARLDGKVVIDATNHVGAPSLNSLAVLAEHAPSALLYRAFNSLGWENFADARYGDDTGDMLYSGPAGQWQRTVEELIAATGLRPVWVGDNDKAQVVDNFTALWFTLAFERGWGRNLGFKLLTR